MLDSFIDAWNDPHARHAMLVHIPIALGLLGVIPVLVLLLTKGKNPWPRWAAIGVFAVASIGAWMAAEAGEDAEHRLEESRLSELEHEALEEHEELGEGGWVWPLIPAALVALTFIPKAPVRITASVLALVASLGVAGWIATTAHHGGKLVYEYGIGVPQRGP